MWQSATLRFDAGHPVAAGHFPGDPIIPGALLLDHVLDVITAGPVHIRAVKFLHIVRPGASLELRWKTVAGGAVAFECLAADGVPAMTGTLQRDGAAA